MNTPFKPTLSMASKAMALALAALVAIVGNAQAQPRQGGGGGGRAFIGGRGPAFNPIGPAYRPGAGYYRPGGHYHGGGWGPGVFWGGLGLGIGIAAASSYYYAPRYYGAPLYYGAPIYYPDTVLPADPGYIVPGAPQPDSSATVPRSDVPAPSSSPNPIFYPRNGQSAAQTEEDRQDCNRWATTQQDALNDARIFQRATLACMDGRGYTVR